MNDSLRKSIKIQLQAAKLKGEFSGTMKSAYDCLKSAGYDWTSEVRNRVKEILEESR